jgi:hypothetical protein
LTPLLASEMINRSRFVEICLLAVVSFLALLFFSYAYLHTVNFPYYDDFNDCAGLVIQWQQSGSWWQKINLLFEQNYEHRVLFLKVISIGYYLITSHLNFSVLILIGDLALIGIWLQYFLLNSNSKPRFWLLLSVAALLFQVQHYESSIMWMTCALQHAPCIFLTTFAVQLALQKRPLTAFFVALITMVSSANGILTPILVLGVLFFEKQYKILKWITPVFIGLAIWHLKTLTTYSGDPIRHLFSDQPARLFSMFAFAGGFSRLFTQSIFINQLVGLLCLFPVLLGIYQVFRPAERKSLTQLQWISLAGLIFVWFTAFLITQFRNEKTDYGFFSLARYNIYYPFFPLFSIGYLNFSLNPKPFQKLIEPGIAFCSLIFCLFTYYYYYSSIIEYRKEIGLNQTNYAWSRVIYYPPIFGDTVSINRFAPIYQQKLIQWEHPFTSYFQGDKLSSVTDTLPATIRRYSDYIEVVNTTLQVHNSRKDDGIYLVLTDEQNAPRYLLYAHHIYPSGYRTFAQHFYRPMSPGFITPFYFNKVQTGHYQIFAVQVEGGTVQKLYRVASIQV